MGSLRHHEVGFAKISSRKRLDRFIRYSISMVRSVSMQGPVQVVVDPVFSSRDRWGRSDLDVRIRQGDPVLVGSIQCVMSAMALPIGQGDDL